MGASCTFLLTAAAMRGSAWAHMTEGGVAGSAVAQAAAEVQVHDIRSVAKGKPVSKVAPVGAFQRASPALQQPQATHLASFPSGATERPPTLMVIPGIHTLFRWTRPDPARQWHAESLQCSGAAGWPQRKRPPRPRDVAAVTPQARPASSASARRHHRQHGEHRIIGGASLSRCSRLQSSHYQPPR